MQTRFRLPSLFPLACLGVAASVTPVAAQRMSLAADQSFFLPQPHATISPISMVTTATIGDSAAGNVSRTTIHAYRGTLAEAVIVAGLDPAFQRFALAHRQLALEAGLPFEFVSGRRSRSRQAELAADRTRTRPAAPPGMSKHEFGLAYDVRASGLTAAQLQRIGQLGEALGLRWGGRFTPRHDPNHFEASWPSGRALRGRSW